MGDSTSVSCEGGFEVFCIATTTHGAEPAQRSSCSLAYSLSVFTA
jgi:hypothetical protein